MSGDSEFTFRIRRISDRPTPPSPEPPAAAPVPAPSVEAQAKPKPAPKRTKKRSSRPAAAPHEDIQPTATAGRFRSPSGVLSFLGSVAGARLARDALCRRGPGGDWWAEVEAPWRETAPFVWAAGGRPFARADGRWQAVSPIGDALAEDDRALETESWPQIELADLLAGIGLRARRLAPASAVEALVPGALARWVLRRATALGVQVTLAPALRRPLENGSAESGVMLMRLRPGEGRNIPVALLQALTSLPYTLVAQPVGVNDGNLLIDVRYRPPLAESLLSGMIPEGEVWALGSPDVGHWRLRLTGEEVNGDELLAPPDLEIADVPSLGDARLPAPLPVRLVSRPAGSGQVDGVLLDDSELAWVRPFLAGRPAGERSFLLAGADRYLLVAPGGLPGSLPFGIPLVHTGPRGLFVELGLGFHPPLPEEARNQAFDLADGRVVAVVEDGAYAFAVADMAPSWALWVGEAPAVRAGLSSRGERLLERISAALQDPEPPRSPLQRLLGRDRDASRDRSRLLKDAEAAQLSGDLVRAAELLESAGELGAAGRLYERAADRSRQR